VRLQDPDLYDDVLADVVAFLTAQMEQAVASGMPRESIVLDPGPDFTKTPHQTLAVLRGLDTLRELGRPLLLACPQGFPRRHPGQPPRRRDAGLTGRAGAAGGNRRQHRPGARRGRVGDVVRTVRAPDGSSGTGGGLSTARGTPARQGRRGPLGQRAGSTPR